MLLGLYGSCSWVSMAFNASETARNARVQACSWVSMAPALGSLRLLLLGLYGFLMLLKLQETHAFKPVLGSLWLLPLGRYGSCSWVSMAFETFKIVGTRAFKPAPGSPWLLLLGLYGF